MTNKKTFGSSKRHPWEKGSNCISLRECYLNYFLSRDGLKTISLEEINLSRIAKNLLTEDGVIFISIDDREQNTLGMICDEIFNT